jgi:nucleoid-associated protein YgaU
VGKETKFGLIVGVAFIVLFGVILGGRVGSAAGDHAPLPVGDSGGHRVIVDTIFGAGDPLAPQDRSLALDEPLPGRTEPVDGRPAEESLPAPEEGTPEASEAVEAPPVGRLAFAPARVETPMPAPAGVEPAPPEEPLGDEVLADEAVEEGAPAPEPVGPPPAPARPVHVVAKGETLTTIARQYYGDDGPRLWRRIWEANKGTLPDPHRLNLGQALVIPGLPTDMAPAGTEVADASDAAADDADAPAPDAERAVSLDDLARRFKVGLDDGAAAPAEPASYTVKKGDTFYSIALQVYGDASLAAKLHERNRDRVPDARRLRVGQTIRLLEHVQTASRSDGLEGSLTQVAAR